MGVQMFEYLRLADDTQVSYSAVREDGTALACVEQPVDMGFNTAWFVMPSCKVIESEGFSSDEIAWYVDFLRNNAPVIMEFAWEGGHVYDCL